MGHLAGGQCVAIVKLSQRRQKEGKFVVLRINYFRLDRQIRYCKSYQEEQFYEKLSCVINLSAESLTDGPAARFNNKCYQ